MAIKQHAEAAGFVWIRPGAPESAFYVMLTPIMHKLWESGLTFPKNIPSYISNLAGLGIVNVLSNVFLDDTKSYAEIESAWTEYFADIIQKDVDLKGRTLVFDKGVIEITRFGKQFIDACRAR